MVPGTVMGDASPNHYRNSQDRIPTFYYIGTLDPLGGEEESQVPAGVTIAQESLDACSPNFRSSHE